ncbi:MAG TPA: M28 family peptidase [Acidobacteriaceae bacterium]|nr:M28 family peptidase [Acidobacteriaceae bacterium]
MSRTAKAAAVILSRRRGEARTPRVNVILSAAKNPCICLLLALSMPFAAATAARAQAPTGLISGQSILTLTKQFLAAAPKRYNGSSGHAAAEKFIKDHFKPEAAKGNFETDQFTANTPAGQQTMRNFIVKFPGKRDGAIVLVTHYETNYPLRNINFVGANDGACTTALLIAIGEYFRAHPPQGYGVWLVFDDGEEAVKDWNYQGQVDHTYGTRHLAAKWDAEGTLKRVKALLVADMIGDKDLDIFEDMQSTGWLRSIFRQAAINTRHTENVFKKQTDEQDDHLPFIERGVPALDVIDPDYGPLDPKTGDAAYHHTAKDTIDKISAQSLQTSADLFLETIRLINQQR